MRMIENILGLVLLLFAWFDPFGFGLAIRIALFIIGFDLMSIFPKVGIFVINFFFPVFGESFGYLSWMLFFLFLSELVISYTESYKSYRLLIKPAAVFATALFALGLQPALILAGIDLLINLTHKIKLGKKSRKRKKPKRRK